MDLDLDAFRARTFDVQLDGKTYHIALAKMEGYMEVLAARKDLGEDAETNIAVLKRMVSALAPELPVATFSPAELNVLLEKLDAFNSGGGGDDSGNPEGA